MSDEPKLRLLKPEQVCARTALSLRELERRAAAGTFPKPLKLSYRVKVWIEHEVDAWIAERIAARNNPFPPEKRRRRKRSDENQDVTP